MRQDRRDQEQDNLYSAPLRLPAAADMIDGMPLQISHGHAAASKKAITGCGPLLKEASSDG